MGKTINPFGKDIIKIETEFCGRTLSLETGRVAFQAGGSVVARYGDSVVLGIANAADEPIEGMDYFPLSIDYEERMYAAGKVSGSRFIKREGRPSEQAIQTARLIDRPIRPLFPKGYKNEVQGIAHVLSLDPDIRPDTLAMIAVSAAIEMTGAPFEGPVAGVRVGQINGELVAYPKTGDLTKSKLDLVVAGTKDGIMMVEAGSDEIDEDTMVKAMELAHQAIQPAIKLQTDLMNKLGVAKQEFEPVEIDAEIQKQVNEFVKGKLGDKVRAANKVDRDQKIGELESSMLADLVGDNEDGKIDENMYKEAYDAALKKEVRRAILDEGVRPDNRKSEDIRPLSSEVGVLPRTHGSAIFTRGSTQALNVTTLAPTSFAQIIDTMEEDTEKTYIHHYNFPGYSTGEIRRLGSPGRREIGHGALAERALMPVIPDVEAFPYMIRTVSELTSSNGSTSMASVCASTLSLMDAGVPIKKPVAGIAMGLMSDGSKNVVLSDIQGAEDFAGDMDFKVAGTDNGITALQMDIKVKGLSAKVLSEALAQAKRGRDVIMESMLATLPTPREKLSPYSPQIEKLKIKPDKIREVIGKGGETINKIIDQTGAEIDIKDDGLVMIAAVDKKSIDAAIKWIKDLTTEPEVGEIYDGKVVSVMDFGAFVEILPGQDGLVHVSEMADTRVNHPSDVVKEGDKVRVKLVAIDDRDRLVLSMKQARKQV